MRKIITLGIMLLFLGMTISSAGFNLEKQSTVTTLDGNTLYVGGSGPGNYTKIQDAIDDSSNGDTVYVYDDSSPYDENLIINKTLDLIGEDRVTTVIDGNESGSVVRISADWVNISEFTIRNSSRSYGLYILGSRNNTIINNNIVNNLGSMLLKDFSHNITIIGNSISNCKKGVGLWDSYGNTISDNSFINNGLWIINSYQNAVFNNTVNGKPLVYLEDKSNIVIDDDAGQVILLYCDNITIKNQDFSNTVRGIELIGTNNCFISGNTISNNSCGVGLYSSNNNTITRNNITSNRGHGICLYSSRGNIITGNNILGNGWYYLWHHGIRFDESTDNTITGNTISLNYYDGIDLYFSNNNTVTGNTISSNNHDGIDLFASNNTIGNNIISNNDNGIDIVGFNNTISGNTISNNDCGVGLSRSRNNIITGNNISNNDCGVGLSSIYFLGENRNNIIIYNIISNNRDGIYLGESGNTVLKNNFIDNKRHAFFEAYKNTWKQNYWNRPRLLPKPIFGRTGDRYHNRLWVNFDWHPALKPYDIPTGCEIE